MTIEFSSFCEELRPLAVPPRKFVWCAEAGFKAHGCYYQLALVCPPIEETLRREGWCAVFTESLVSPLAKRSAVRFGTKKVSPGYVREQRGLDAYAALNPVCPFRRGIPAKAVRMEKRYGWT